MPLQSGSSREVVSKNISEMVHAGHPQKQAVAAALNKSREDAVPGGGRQVPSQEEEAQSQRPLPEQLARAENELEQMEREHESEQLGLHRKHMIADHKKRIRALRDAIKQQARDALATPASKGDAAERGLEELEAKQDVADRMDEFTKSLSDMVDDCERKMDELQAKFAKAECDDGGPGSGPRPKVGTGVVPTGTAATGRPGYNREAVNKAIASSNRSGQKIGGREAQNIHRLLSGRH